jgi:hypothetical protein
VRGKRAAAFRLRNLSGKGFDGVNTAGENVAQRFGARLGIVERLDRLGSKAPAPRP